MLREVLILEIGKARALRELGEDLGLKRILDCERLFDCLLRRRKRPLFADSAGFFKHENALTQLVRRSLHWPLREDFRGRVEHVVDRLRRWRLLNLRDFLLFPSVSLLPVIQSTRRGWQPHGVIQKACFNGFHFILIF